MNMNGIELKKRLGRKVELTGIARDAKGGAVLVTEKGEPIYIENLPSWPEDLFGKEVTMEGIIKEEKFIPDPVIEEYGAISQGAIGIQLVLEDGKILKKDG